MQDDVLDSVHQEMTEYTERVHNRGRDGDLTHKERNNTVECGKCQKTEPHEPRL